MRLLTALFLAVSFFAAAQSPEVPHKMEFAGMTLTIRDDARREIQKDVDALTISPRHYNIKAERAKTYFPIIEKIFAEEGVPDDFKYLSLQESALIADAVSTSNAVGFWQFKDFTAIEMGLRIDKDIDERLNIASSTRAAARYLKKNNTFFDNWLYALQSYQMGAGGVMKTVKGDYSGHTRAEITSKTYWYVKKFLAHKIAFESGVNGKGQTEVLVYENRKEKTLSAIAQEVSVDENELKNYNKWTKSGVVPGDKMYTVVIPLTSPAVNTNAIAVAPKTDSNKVVSEIASSAAVKTVKGKINGITTIQAVAGDNATKLASRAQVDLTAFLKWNEISVSTPIKPGMHYFLGKKRVRAVEDYHKLEPGENLWTVSQRYGVRLKRLKKFNRLGDNESVKPGTTLWLSAIKPKENKTQEQSVIAVKVDDGETFNWEFTPEANTEITVVSTPVQEPSPAVILPKDSVENKVDSTENLQQLVIESTSVVDSVVQTPVQMPAPLKTHHTVQAGETLYGIAKVYNVGVMDLVNWNKLNLQEGIKPGQILKLSDNQMITEATPATKEVVHEVMVSDTLYSIARKYGVTIKELMEWNGKKDFSLAVGEKLKVMQAR